MGKYNICIRLISANAVLIEWPQRIDEAILDDIISFKIAILDRDGDLIVNHTPAYASLLIQYKEAVDFDNLSTSLYQFYHEDELIHTIENKTWHIPVCYHESLGVDLETFYEVGIDHLELIRLHTNAVYRVYMIGFLPGFLYLGGLPEELFMPRKATPNLRTPRGAVAIGGNQTGIYPIASPGGWHVIGRTPFEMFDMDEERPIPINQGDIVRFYEVNLKTYEVLSN